MKILKKLRKEKGLTQSDIAKTLNMSYQAYAKYENNLSQPNIYTLEKLAEIYGVTIDFLLGKTVDKPCENVKNKGIRIPVLGYVQAGIPIDAIEEIIDYEEITEKMASNGEYFALEVRGDSMEPRMQQGDVVIVRRQDDVENGEVAIVLVNGDQGTIKKVRKTETGISLIPENTSYETRFFSFKTIEELPVTILGKVVELRVKF